MIRVLLLAVLLLLTACQTGGGVIAPLEVYAVRHAEKLSGPDPDLTADGLARAGLLAEMMEARGITAVHSTDTLRTRRTAQPTADAVGVEVELYGPSDLEALIRGMRARGGAHLVVGHSNTTPALVERLGGEPGEPIREADEYDRLYRIGQRGAGTSTELIRFGD